MADQLIGGWSSWNFDVSEEDRATFEKALEDILGVDYGPVYAVAFRATSVCNFVFLCRGIMVNPDQTTNLYKVYVTALSGKVKLENIEVVSPVAQGLYGGWASWTLPADRSENTKMLQEALGKIIGVDYDLIGYTSRVLSGTAEFACFAKGTVVTPEQNTMAVIAYVLNGVVSHIEEIPQAQTRVTENA